VKMRDLLRDPSYETLPVAIRLRTWYNPFHTHSVLYE
jgi:hypothetical protein